MKLFTAEEIQNTIEQLRIPVEPPGARVFVVVCVQLAEIRQARVRHALERRA